VLTQVDNIGQAFILVPGQGYPPRASFGNGESPGETENRISDQRSVGNARTAEKRWYGDNHDEL